MKGCASCHGTKGQGNTMMKGPKLAGQTQQELARKIKAYRSGERNNPTMAMMTYSLSDEEIENLAAYFSQFK
ncbi:c-type cytochrome [Sansalvadorimonas verongulae]|uniref:c-type cytochrome n=1 Tax=Sansalvadorimonas verongulae TaxID=2172824 RepID=UPI0012BB69B1|nr:c-type cytochrome [Sansalvadorimonas verongulae]MTI13670.1 c-type cytochrome [Sansalvadorimonas verongulae]